MGNPAYDARREAERAEAEKDLAANETARAAFEAVTAFMSGRARLEIASRAFVDGGGWNIRFVRDQE